MQCIKTAVTGWMLVVLASLAAAPGTAAAAEPAPPAVTDFFSAPAMAQPKLSPSGKYLAVQLPSAYGRQILGVIDTEPPRKGRPVATFSDADVDDFEWVNDDRLVLTVRDAKASYFRGIGPGLYAVDRTGDALRPLVQREWEVISTSVNLTRRELPPNHALHDVLRDGSNDVIVERYNLDNEYRNVVSTNLLRLDTVTGRATPVDTGFKNLARRWLVDEKGVARVAVSSEGARSTVYWRSGINQPWAAISSGQTYTGDGQLMEPWSIGRDNRLYALAGMGPAATEALFVFDADKRKLEAEPLFNVAGFDFRGGLIFDGKTHQLIGVRYTGDATSTVWLTDEMKALQARIDKRLPGLNNLVDIAECGCSRWVVVTSYSDRQPQVYWLYDRESDKLESIGQSRPKIDARQMGPRDFERIAARDGQQIPLHVTKPNSKLHGAGPWPAVVLVHGGPYVRGGSWEWTEESQFLASRGYLVLEPEFRGSTGYGDRHFRAGWKQWGLAMQDDIADATRWAVKQGLATPNRICIAGASYGGYATLMGLIRDPDLYRCGVAWVAVTDIQLLFDIHWSDLGDNWKDYGMPTLVGDPKTMAEQFAATSPLKQAQRLKQPVLLAFGGSDRRVPIDHGTKMRRALQEAKTPVEWIEYPDEGHGWLKPENRFDFWTRVEKFLAKQLAAPAN